MQHGASPARPGTQRTTLRSTRGGVESEHKPGSCLTVVARGGAGVRLQGWAATGVTACGVPELPSAPAVLSNDRHYATMTGGGGASCHYRDLITK